MPKHQKSHMAKGLEMMLNDPRTNLFTTQGQQGFKAVLDASNLPLTETLRYLGKNKKKVAKKPESDISAERLQRLEEHSSENQK